MIKNHIRGKSSEALPGAEESSPYSLRVKTERHFGVPLARVLVYVPWVRPYFEHGRSRRESVNVNVPRWK